MKKIMIFDASVIVTSYVSGKIYKTGIYRVSYEILCGLVERGDYEIYLFDIFGRERELRKYVSPIFEQTQVVSIESKLYRTFAYPLYNVADNFRIREYHCTNKGLKYFYKFFKNCFQTLGRSFRYFEKKRKILSNFMNLNNSGVYLSTYYPIPLNVEFLFPLRKAIIIHDLIPILYPNYFYDKDNKILLENIIGSVSEKDIVICVSESTKRDFLKQRPSFPSDKVFVVPLAGSSCFKPNLSIPQLNAVREKYHIPLDKSYFLSVCTIEPRKNINLLLLAYEQLLKQSKRNEIPYLVLTGVYGWKSQSLIDTIKQLNDTFCNNIILTGFVADEELALLYSHTIVFVYPSLYEGFGLPPLEAMQCGAPIITSNNSSLPEVVGNAGIMIDANDVTAMLNSYLTCLDNQKVSEMREKSLQRAATFSWNKTVDNILNIFT